MASKNLDVGVKYTGDAKDFKRASDEARKESARLRKESVAHSKEMERKFKDVTMALAKVGAAVIVAQKAFEQFDRAMRTTGEGADKMERFTAKLTAGVDALGRSLVNNDFDNLAQNIKNAMRAAGEQADMEDLNDARERDLSLRKSSLEGRIRELKVLKQEGTINKEQVTLLKTLSEELYQTEQDILESRIRSKIKFATDSRSIDASIFNDLQEGVIARSKLNEDELKSLASVTEETKATMKKLRDAYTSVEYYGSGVDEKTRVEKFDKAGYSKELTDYLKGLSNVERVQVFEDLFSNEQDWIKLIEYWNQLNQGMTEYQSNISMINRSGKDAGNQNTGHGTESGVYNGLYTGWQGPMVGSQIEGMNKLSEVTMATTQSFLDYEAAVSNLEGTFNSLFRSSLEGWENFGEVFKGIFKDVVAKLLTLITMYTILNILSGGSFGAVTSLGQYIKEGFGVTPNVAGGGVAGGVGVGTTMLKGRDIAIASNRSSNVIFKNT